MKRGGSDPASTFFGCKEGNLGVGRTKKGKRTMMILRTEAEGVLISTLVDIGETKNRSRNLLFDKVADEDWLRDAVVCSLD